MKRLMCLLYLVVAAQTVQAQEVKSFVYDEHGKRDPFAPIVSASGVFIAYDADMTATDMSLEGLVIDAKGNNLAIINGKIVKTGDQVGAYTVETVANDHVDLVKGQERLTVRLKKGAS